MGKEDTHERVGPERPKMQGYGISSGEEGLLRWDWVDERMSASRNYWISTTRPDGRPHAAPVWGVWVDGTLYFGSGPGSQKARNLAHNPNIAVHLESGDEVVILEAEAEVVTNPDPELSARVGEAYDAKYGMRSDSIEGYYAVRPEVVLAWREHDFPTSATRWRFGG